MFAAFSGFYPTIKPPLRARARFKIYISRAKTRIENSTRRRNFWPTRAPRENPIPCDNFYPRSDLRSLSREIFLSSFPFRRGFGKERRESFAKEIEREREREQNLSSRVLRFFRPRLNITDKMWLPVYWILARFARFGRKGNLQCTLSTPALLSVVLFLSSRFVISRIYIYMYMHVYAFAITIVSRHWFTILLRIFQISSFTHTHTQRQSVSRTQNVREAVDGCVFREFDYF